MRVPPKAKQIGQSCSMTGPQESYPLPQVGIHLSLLVAKGQPINMYERVEVYLHAFLTMVLDGGEISASRSSPFSPSDQSPVPWTTEGFESQ
jgi:hypothetical protein